MATSLQLPHLTTVTVDSATRTKRSAMVHRVFMLVVHCLWILLKIAVFGAIVLWTWENLE